MCVIWECPLKWATPPKSLVFWSTSRAEQRKQLANLVTPDSILIHMPHRTIHLPISESHERWGRSRTRILRQVAACSLMIWTPQQEVSIAMACHDPFALCVRSWTLNRALTFLKEQQLSLKSGNMVIVCDPFFCWCCLFLLVSLLNLFLYSTLFHCLQMQLRGMTMSCWWNPMLRSPESHHRYFAPALLTQVGQPRAAVDAAELQLHVETVETCWNLKPPTFTVSIWNIMKSTNQLTSSHQPGINQIWFSQVLSAYWIFWRSIKSPASLMPESSRSSKQPLLQLTAWFSIVQNPEAFRI